MNFSCSSGWLDTIYIQAALTELSGSSKEGLELGERCKCDLSGIVGEYINKILFKDQLKYFKKKKKPSNTVLECIRTELIWEFKL